MIFLLPLSSPLNCNRDLDVVLSLYTWRTSEPVVVDNLSVHCKHLINSPDTAKIHPLLLRFISETASRRTFNEETKGLKITH